LPHSTIERADETEQAVQRVQLFDLVLSLLRGKRFVALCAIAGALLAGIATFIVSPKFTATVAILPPQHVTSQAASLLSQFSGGDFGGDPLRNTSELYATLMSSRTVQNRIIADLNLSQAFRTNRLMDSRRVLSKATEFRISHDGVLTVLVTTKDPNLSAKIADEYVGELQRLNSAMDSASAQQRRDFYESRVTEAQQELARAESELRSMQEKTGVVQIDAQAEMLVRELAQSDAAITEAEVHLRGMSAYATAENPEMRRAEAQLARLKEQRQHLEDSRGGGLSVRKGPSVGLEYMRKLREVKYREALLDMLLKQLAAARLDESQAAPDVRIVDKAEVPEMRSSPARTQWLIAGAFLGLLFAILFLVTRELLRQLSSRESMRMRFELIRHQLTDWT
jgi:tyrosine-protein kinase Etk/Wzc